ncbi:MAG: hypothetical protein KDA44_22335 [Planctomycetales bacterium]|nr:hypothetical protein [Planctomycetales bacterium]
MPAPRPSVPNWQDGFLALLPEIERQLDARLRSIPRAQRDDARQTILASAAVGYAQLAAQGRAALAFPTPLVRFGLQQFRAGRLVAGRTSSLDVGSTRWRRTTARRVESLADWQDTLVAADQRRATPAEIAALRIDFTAWLQTLSERDRQITCTLARGEETRAVARTFQISAGRVSQLRRELHDSWQRFCGEPALAGA